MTDKHFLDNFAAMAAQTNFDKDGSKLIARDEDGDQRIFTKT